MVHYTTSRTIALFAILFFASVALVVPHTVFASGVQFRVQFVTLEGHESEVPIRFIACDQKEDIMTIAAGYEFYGYEYARRSAARYRHTNTETGKNEMCHELFGYVTALKVHKTAKTGDGATTSIVRIVARSAGAGHAGNVTLVTHALLERVAVHAPVASLFRRGLTPPEGVLDTIGEYIQMVQRKLFNV